MKRQIVFLFVNCVAAMGIYGFVFASLPQVEPQVFVALPVSQFEKIVNVTTSEPKEEMEPLQNLKVIPSPEIIIHPQRFRDLPHSGLEYG